MNYNYKISIDLDSREYFLLSGYLSNFWGMKPQIVRTSKGANLTLFGHSLEEKSKNKKMILNAIHDFRLHMFHII